MIHRVSLVAVFVVAMFAAGCGGGSPTNDGKGGPPLPPSGPKAAPEGGGKKPGATPQGKFSTKE